MDKVAENILADERRYRFTTIDVPACDRCSFAIVCIFVDRKVVLYLRLLLGQVAPTDREQEQLKKE